MVDHTPSSAPRQYYNLDTWKQITQGNLIIGVKDVPQISKTGDCAGMDVTRCQKIDEKICDQNDSGCGYTVQNYHATGLIPLAGCYNQASLNTGATWTFCADGSRITYQSGANRGILESGSDVWWNIHRTYTCEAGALYDFTSVQQRSAILATKAVSEQIVRSIMAVVMGVAIIFFGLSCNKYDLISEC